MITITDKKIKMTAEEYNKFLGWFGGEGEINKNGIVELNKDGTLELREEEESGYLSRHTYYIYDFYRPNHDNDPDWDEIVAKARHFNKNKKEDDEDEKV